MHIHLFCLFYYFVDLEQNSTDLCIQPKSIQTRSLNKAAMLGSSSALLIVTNCEATFLRQIMHFFRAWLKRFLLRCLFRLLSENNPTFWRQAAQLVVGTVVTNWTPPNLCFGLLHPLLSKWSSCWHDQNIPGTIIFQVQKMETFTSIN